jgi:hypothetical protein
MSLRIAGRYVVPPPFTLVQLSALLRCGVLQADRLVREREFPHAFIDCDGQWRVPLADVHAYIRAKKGGP